MIAQSDVAWKSTWAGREGADRIEAVAYTHVGLQCPGGWLPREPLALARVQRWLSLAAGPLASGPAAARLVAVFRAPLDHERAKALAHDFFAVVDRHLVDAAFLTGNGPTIADLAHYAYSAHAPEGGVALDRYPNLGRWLARVEALPGFVAMKHSGSAPSPEAAS